jgi:F0F1-type ATP synthase membrane subunit c/vacuolar-type H+-ATPase subunit K
VVEFRHARPLGQTACVAQSLNPEDDPGWPGVMSALVFLVPGAVQRQARKPGTDGLVLMRQAVQGFSVTLVLIGVVVAFVQTRAGSPLPSAAILAAVAIGSVVVARLAEKPLDCTSPTALAGSYRTRFFVQVALAESVAMVGFLFAFLGGPRWIYFAGAAFALVRFWTGIAPTRAVLARDQRALAAQGCGQSLIAALRGGPPTSA